MLRNNIKGKKNEWIGIIAVDKPADQILRDKHGWMVL